MSVEVNLSANLALYTQKQEKIATGGTTVGECLEDVIRQFPAVKSAIFDREGKVHRYLELFVNQTAIQPAEIDMPVKDGDVIHVILIIAGG
jgi:molybdopterin converting factor small subunit